MMIVVDTGEVSRSSRRSGPTLPVITETQDRELSHHIRATTQSGVDPNNGPTLKLDGSRRPRTVGGDKVVGVAYSEFARIVQLRRSSSPMHHTAVLHPMWAPIYRSEKPQSTGHGPLSLNAPKTSNKGDNDLEEDGLIPQHWAGNVTETKAFRAAIWSLTKTVEYTEVIDDTFGTCLGLNLPGESVEEVVEPRQATSDARETSSTR